MNLSWEGLFKLGYKLEVKDPTKQNQRRQIHQLASLWVVSKFGWPIRLAKGQV